jgi:hypothetical protein
MHWFKRLAAATIQSVITTNKNGLKFFNVIGNTFPIKDQLRDLGFKYFKGTWGMFLDKAKANRAAIEALGVDTSSMDQVVEQPTQPASPAQPAQPTESAPQVQAESAQLESTLAKMRKAIDDAIKSGSAQGGVKNILDVVDRELDNLAAMVDKEAKSEIVKSFLAFASKFWNYSLGNQILIWVQNPKATYVSGYRAWLEKGRQVTKWNEAISILRPQESKIKLPEPEKKYEDRPDIGSEIGDPDYKPTPRMKLYFVPTKVYDITATEPIPGWKDKEGNGPFMPPPLKVDPNDQLDHVTALVDAAKAFASDVGIKVDLEKLLEEELGGYSAGKSVVVNKLYQGVNQFGTLAHELAHEILHREDDQVTPIKEQRQAKEIDAETTAYIVLKHYGYESKSAPQYLALWRATGEDMKKRRMHVAKATKIIIDNINKYMGKMEMEDNEALATTALTHWLMSGLKLGA